MRPKNSALWPSSASEAIRCRRRQESTSSETQSPPLEAVRDSARRRMAARQLRACSSMARSARSSWSSSVSRSLVWLISVVPVAGAVAFDESTKKAPVVPVAQQLQGDVGGQPAQLVNLCVGEEMPAGQSHLPVGDSLQAPAPVPVPHPPQEVTGPASQPGLLRGLAPGSLLLGLAVVQLSLRERPVVLQGAMDERQLETPPPVPVAAPDDSPGGSHDPPVLLEHAGASGYTPERLLARN